MASLGSLVISLAADTARFEGDLGRAAAIAESRMRNIKDSATRALGALTVVASAAGAALVAGLKQATDRADDMRDLAAASGVTVEQLSRLEFAGKQSGVELERIGKALAKLAAGGAQNANTELIRLADQFQAMPDGAAKTAKAIEIFGEKLGPGLIPLLNEGSAGLQAMADASDQFGATISGETAAAADAFNDNLGSLKLAAQGFSNTLAAKVLPSLVLFTDYVVASIKSGEDFQNLVGGITDFLKGLVTVADYGVTTFVSLGRAIGATFAAIGALVSGSGSLSERFSQAKSILSDLRKDADDTSQHFAERFVALWGPAGVQAAEAVKKPIEEAAKQSTDWISQISKDQFEMLSKLNRDTAADVAKDINKAYDGTYYTLEVRAKEATETITDYSRRAAENMQDAFAQFLFDPFQDGLKGMLRGFIDVIRQMVAQQAAAQIFGSKSSGGFGLADIVSGGLKSFFGGFRASGGPVSAGRGYVVGEKGPELFMPGKSGTIVPNGAAGGSISVVNNIDARGATQDSVQLLGSMIPAIIEQSVQQSVARVRDLSSRRGF